MKDKTKEQMMNELAELRKRITELEVTVVERKQAEEALRESEEKFRIFMETASDTMHITDKDGKFTWVNESMVRTFGYSKKEVIGMHITQFLTKETLENTFKSKAKELLTKGEISFADTWLAKGGREIYGELKVVAFYASDGKYAGSREVFRDRTERKKLEEQLEQLIKELQESLAKVKTLIGLLPICVYCWKLRDNKGYWLNVEQYISTHTLAELTHGICPECEKKYFSTGGNVDLPLKKDTTF